MDFDKLQLELKKKSGVFLEKDVNGFIVATGDKSIIYNFKTLEEVIAFNDGINFVNKILFGEINETRIKTK